MPEVAFGNLLAVCAVAFAAPLVLGFWPRLRVPAAVLEILIGVVLGPGLLGWVKADLPVQVLAVVGLAFLLFLAGLEVDVRLLRGRQLRGAATGYAITLALGAGVGLALSGLGWIDDPVLLAIALSATSLGLVVPVLKDSGHARGAFGQQVIAAASLADVAAIVLVTLLFSAAADSLSGRGILLAGFVVLVATVTVVVARVGRLGPLMAVLGRLQDTTAQIRVRACVLLLIGFVALASQFGLEQILGAFMAGAVVGLIDRGSTSHPHLRTKLEAIGYGFVIPIFFISSGLRLDLRGLLASGTALAQVPVLLLALLVVRGLAAAPLLSRFGVRQTLAGGALLATSLPFLVTAGQIGVVTGAISSVTAAALVCAGLLSVLIFPAIAVGLLRSESAPEPPEPSGSSEQPEPSEQAAAQPRVR